MACAASCNVMFRRSLRHHLSAKPITCAGKSSIVTVLYTLEDFGTPTSPLVTLDSCWPRESVPGPLPDPHHGIAGKQRGRNGGICRSPCCASTNESETGGPIPCAGTFLL